VAAPDLPTPRNRFNSDRTPARLHTMHETKDWRVRVPVQFGSKQVIAGLTKREAEAHADKLAKSRYGNAGISSYENSRTVYVESPEGFK